MGGLALAKKGMFIHCINMVKQIKKLGNSHGLILDRSIMDQLGIADGSPVDLRISGRSLVVTPVEDKVSDAELDQALSDTLREFNSAFERLAK